MYGRARRLAYEMLDAETAEAAARRSCKLDGPGLVEGLCHLAERAAADGRLLAAGVAALRALGGRGGPRAREALRDALDAPAPALRSEAARALIGRADATCAPALTERVRRDEAPVVRLAALRALARLPPALAASIVHALGDPVWRVRRDALRLLMAPPPRGPGVGPGAPAATLAALGGALRALGPLGDTERGALEYLARRAGVRLGEGGPGALAAAPPRPPYWDDDPAVLLENVRREGQGVLASGGPLVAELLAFQESRPYNECALRLRAWAAALLERAGRPEDFVHVVALLGEPRRPFVRETVDATLGRLDPPRREAVAATLFDAPAAPAAALAWAATHAGGGPFAARAASLLAHEDRAPRLAAARRLAASGDEPLLFDALGDGDEAVRAAALEGVRRAPWALVAARVRPEGGPAWRRAYAAARAARGEAVECEAAALEALADDDAQTRAAVATALLARGRSSLPPAAARALEALSVDGDDRVRAAALDRASAEALLAEPEREPSFRVLARAASLLGLPTARLALGGAGEPAATTPVRAEVEPSDSPFLYNRPTLEARERRWARRPVLAADEAPAPPAPAAERPLGATGLRLPPLAISGRYGLPPEAFDEALGRGARLFFWEPTYEGQTHFLRRLPSARRASLSLIAGSFEAEPRAVRRDAEHALSALGVEAVDVFVLFWVRSPARLSDGVAEALARLREAGKVKTFALSTHRRDLAARAADEGWPALMVRHSAAHRGAEGEVFPRALAQGAGVLTFSNLCYGRLLRPGAGERPSAADLYRYSLAQPGVSCCISGPRNVAQLRENLAVLESPALPPGRLDALRAWGDRVYQENREFFELVRWR
ncbi:MAG TPA: HEAT repeat domain-containing protein [Polyangiaceae bacterium]|nr:HEAT repeat domain-containing protein [Polyangiaceae bacterium]